LLANLEITDSIAVSPVINTQIVAGNTGFFNLNGKKYFQESDLTDDQLCALLTPRLKTRPAYLLMK